MDFCLFLASGYNRLMGRKPLDPRDRRESVVFVRLTSAELEAINTAAQSLGLSAAAWLRVLGLQHAKKNRTKVERDSLP